MSQAGENVVRSYGRVRMPNNHSKYRTKGVGEFRGSPVELTHGDRGAGVEPAPPCLPGRPLGIRHVGGGPADPFPGLLPERHIRVVPSAAAPSRD